MSELYNRIERLCVQNKVTITAMCRESGASRASLSDLKVGRKQSLSADTLDKIANYFSTTVDYLLGRTDDPTDYDDGEVLAEIPLSYVDACDGDVRRARALMLAVDEDAMKEKTPILTKKDERITAQNEDEEDMILLARHMEPIPEEDRRALKEQFKSSIDLYLKAKGLSPQEDE